MSARNRRTFSSLPITEKILESLAQSISRNLVDWDKGAHLPKASYVSKLNDNLYRALSHGAIAKKDLPKRFNAKLITASENAIHITFPIAACPVCATKTSMPSEARFVEFF